MLDFKGDISTLGMIFKNWRLAYHSWQRQCIKTIQTGQVNLTEHAHSAVHWNANVDLWGNSKGRGAYANEHCHWMKV